MIAPLFFVYVLVEVAAVVALASAAGFGWTLLIVLAAFFGGLAVAGSQLKRQLRRLGSGQFSAGAAMSDPALVALGTLLVVVPGLVTTAVGVLLLLPPTRALARPVVTALVARSLGRRAPAAYRGYSEGEIIEGEIIDGEIVGPTVVHKPSS